VFHVILDHFHTSLFILNPGGLLEPWKFNRSCAVRAQGGNGGHIVGDDDGRGKVGEVGACIERLDLHLVRQIQISIQMFPHYYIKVISKWIP